MNIKSYILLAAACLLMAAWACGGGGGGQDDGNGNGQPQTAGFNLTVLDPGDNPVEDADVSTARGTSGTTNASGEVSFSGLDASSDLIVTVEAAGHVDRTETYPLTGGETASGNISLIARTASQTLDADDGGEVTNSDGAAIDVPGGGLVDSDGDPLSGDVDVSLTYLDVSNKDQRDAAPGDWSARQEDGSSAELESYGVLEVFIDDGTGEEADLAAGESGEITIPIPGNVQADAPETMGLYSFDEDTGEWVEEGELTKNEAGDAYTGTVDHFSTWNADKPMETVCYRVTVLDADGDPVSNAFVSAQGVDYNGSDGGFTNSNGVAEVGARIDSEVEFTLDDLGGYFDSYELQRNPTRNTPPTPQSNCDDSSPTVTLNTTGTDDGNDGDDGDDGDGDADPSNLPGDYSLSSTYIDSFGCDASQTAPDFPTSVTITEADQQFPISGVEAFYDLTSGDNLTGNGFLFQPSAAPGGVNDEPVDDGGDFSCPYDEEVENMAQDEFSGLFSGDANDPFFVGSLEGSGADSDSFSLWAPYDGSTDLQGIGFVDEDETQQCSCQHYYRWNGSIQ